MNREGERLSPWRHCVTVTGVSLNCTSADVIVLFWRESVTADSHNTIYSVCKQSAAYSTVPCRPFNAFPSRRTLLALHLAERILITIIITELRTEKKFLLVTLTWPS